MRPAMRRQNRRSALYYLSFVGQLGFSIVTPIVLATWGAYWLSCRFSLGGWVVILGILLGLGGAAVSFMKVVRAASDGARKQEDEDA